MNSSGCLDTDVLLKLSAYRLANEFIALFSPLCDVGALGLTHFIAEKQLSRHKNIVDKAAAADELSTLLNWLSVIEPREQEVIFAAKLEELGQSLALSFHRGEAQLLAILLSRGFGFAITGDKLAISAIETILAAAGKPGSCARRILCLEQILLVLIDKHDTAELRSLICREPNVDTAVRVSFGCANVSAAAADIRAGLVSYIAFVRSAAQGVLIEDAASIFRQEDCIRCGELRNEIDLNDL